ncbi:MAG: TetR/AcrR family transcriptional regulator [Sphingomicrobium sp.]
MTDPNPIVRKSRAATKVETRQRLLDAARGVFTSVGYQGATLDDIAAKAGYTKGALYWHFPNKQALFMALVSDSIAQNMKVLASLADATSDGPSAEARLASWIDGIDERETLPQFGVELEIEARRDPSFRAIHQAMIAKHEAALCAFLERYYALVDRRPLMPIADLATALITVFKGFSLARQNRPNSSINSAKVVRLLMGMPIA